MFPEDTDKETAIVKEWEVGESVVSQHKTHLHEDTHRHTRTHTPYTHTYIKKKHLFAVESSEAVLIRSAFHPLCDAMFGRCGHDHNLCRALVLISILFVMFISCKLQKCVCL